MTDPTPKQLAMARRIAETLIPDGLDPNLSLRVGIRGIAEQAALAAIIETSEEVASWLYSGLHDWPLAVAEEIATALRNGDHLK